MNPCYRFMVGKLILKFCVGFCYQHMQCEILQENVTSGVMVNEMITIRPADHLFEHKTNNIFIKCQFQSERVVSLPIKRWVNRVMLGLPSIINLTHTHTHHFVTLMPETDIPKFFFSFFFFLLGGAHRQHSGNALFK